MVNEVVNVLVSVDVALDDADVVTLLVWVVLLVNVGVVDAVVAAVDVAELVRDVVLVDEADVV